MSLEDNKTLVRRWLEVMNGGDSAVLDELVAADMVNHEDVSGLPGREGFRRTIATFADVIPDQRMELLDIVAEDDLVAARLQWSGTPQGMFLGRQTAGKRFSVMHQHIFRVADGMLAEHWANRDDFGMLVQLGYFPGPAAANAGG